MTTIRKCLFPAAGYGTRFLPATKSMPKEMLPVVDKPLIQYAVEEAINAGATKLVFVTGSSKRAIEDHFDVSYELEHQLEGSDREQHLDDIRRLQDSCTYTYTRQRRMRGLGDAILTGEVLIGREPFGVLLADDLCCFVGESDRVLELHGHDGLEAAEAGHVAEPSTIDMRVFEAVVAPASGASLACVSAAADSSTIQRSSSGIRSVRRPSAPRARTPASARATTALPSRPQCPGRCSPRSFPNSPTGAGPTSW